MKMTLCHFIHAWLATVIINTPYITLAYCDILTSAQVAWHSNTHRIQGKVAPPPDPARTTKQP